MDDLPRRWRPGWRTVATERIVLAVAHNVTAATRLLDVLPVIATDHRVQVAFTCPGSSPFTEGTVEYLTRRGITVLAWPEALRLPADIAVAASIGGDLHELKCPLIVVPHGMGYNKFLRNQKSEIRNQKSVFGLSAPWLLHDGRVVPAALALSHDEQLDRLRANCPEAVDVAVVVGDPVFDRLRASLPLRESYRQAFGLTPGQRLVVVSSTWGERSLYGHDPGLIAELATSLPIDAYRVVVALHPNIIHGHDRWQVTMWLADGARNGVLVLPDEDLWRPALIAADAVIGDHGSVTFYAAAIGRPVILATAPEDTVDPLSPIASLLRVAPRLRRDKDLSIQVDRAIDGHEPARYRPITALTTSRPGSAAVAMRDLLSARLDLPARPGSPTVATLPLPELELPRHRAHLATATFGADDRATVVRFATGAPNAPTDAHLVVDVDAPDAALLELAEIVVHPSPRDPAAWVTATLSALPGLLIAIAREPGAREAGNTWLAGTASGALIRVTAPDPTAASVLHAWLATGRPLPDLPRRIMIHTAATTAAATFTVLR